MRNKIFLLILFVPFLFGCTVDYDLTIYNEEIKEDTTIKTIYSKENLDNIEIEMKYPTFAKKSEIFDSYTTEKIQGISYYNKSKYEQDSLLGINYNYKFNIDDYNDSYAASQCYDKFSFIVDNQYLVLSTNNYNKCFKDSNIDNIRIHLKTNHKMEDNNADEVDGYNYYWNINSTNYNNKTIYIKLYKNKYVFNYENSALPYIIVTVSVAILIFIVIIFLRKRDKRNNEI
ncbi:MAG: hypothetical protein ACI4OG_04010 [Bacilli bacterium]